MDSRWTELRPFVTCHKRGGRLPQDTVVSSAPGRAGIVGNPSDMYGGAVISVAIDRRAFVAIEPADELTLNALDAGVSQTIHVPDDLALAPYPSPGQLRDLDPGAIGSLRRLTYLNVLKAVLSEQPWGSRTARLTCWSDIPPNAGLSSSSALVAAALHATDRFLNVERDSYDAAETARSIEFHRMGITCGYQDFYATTFGGLPCMDFRGKERWLGPNLEPLASVENLAEASGTLPFVVANTGVQRESSSPHRPLRDRWLQGDPEVIDGMRALANIARNARELFGRRDWAGIAKLMTDNQRIIRSLGGSGQAVEQLLHKVTSLGAAGAKLAGAGHGGTIICISHEPETFAERLTRKHGVEAFAVTRAARGVSSEDPEAWMAHLDRRRMTTGP